MSCERCGQGPGVITYTEYGEDGARKLKICPTCARELGFEVGEGPAASAASPAPPPPAVSPAGPVGKIVGILGIEIQTGPGRAEPDDPRECPGCGMTGNELRRQPLFGCPQCYETFRDSLDPLFRRIHGAVAHRGRVPGGVARPVDTEDLRRDLRNAIASEDYERAARLRDRLRRASGSDDEPAGPES